MDFLLGRINILTSLSFFGSLRTKDKFKTPFANSWTLAAEQSTTAVSVE